MLVQRDDMLSVGMLGFGVSLITQNEEESSNKPSGVGRALEGGWLKLDSSSWNCRFVLVQRLKDHSF